MTYKTSQGRIVEYPMAIAIKAETEDAKYVVGKTRAIFRELQNLDAELITMREENKRLRYENEFMLRLINERNQS